MRAPLHAPPPPRPCVCGGVLQRHSSATAGRLVPVLELVDGWPTGRIVERCDPCAVWTCNRCEHCEVL